MAQESLIERRRKYARAIWDAMVSDSVPDDKTLWEHGYDDAADAAILLADGELQETVEDRDQAIEDRDVLQRVIDGAYDAAMEFGDDAPQALICVVEWLGAATSEGR